MTDATTSLLTEHFSYTPLSLIDDIINSINNLIYQAISSLETGLLNTPPERLGFAHAANESTIPDTDEDGNVIYPEAQLEIENGLHQLETLLEATVDRTFDKFELFVLRNTFKVPEDLMGWIRLKHYENIDLHPPEDAPTPDTIAAQRKKLLETKKLNRALKQESAQNEAIIAQLRQILSANGPKPDTTKAGDEAAPSTTTANTTKDLDLSFLTSSAAARQLRVGAVAGSNTQHTPITTNTTFILSQLPALQALIKELRPKLATLQQSEDKMEVDSKADARREYIESRVRLHLERSGQLAAGNEVNPVLTGRRIDVAEAQALESVMGLLAEGQNKSA
ncbi:putative MIND kinetochore complex component Mtw1 [Aspergillus japonicus CBS 114.51]|uniref:Putative MIND kinetochore complex component Mtw1 n=1 Tax=Aspergillus japonicus CBS 114.51 TaxID=1448312 RepID=A0A8T8WVG0_ASPJA|nr:putative MIND kinetochore complex component Mtw1 [Aspergillus japonicus CBS 114.51]RAH79847.1 putative MIND kinetochore complex component Mtw1 [Aspergillus japonicus CBS 114.51]